MPTKPAKLDPDHKRALDLLAGSRVRSTRKRLRGAVDCSVS
jgi:hypothetical protein